MCVIGFALAFISAGIADGSNMLHTQAGVSPFIMAALAFVMMLPTLIHIVKAGEL